MEFFFGYILKKVFDMKYLMTFESYEKTIPKMVMIEKENEENYKEERRKKRLEEELEAEEDKEEKEE